MIKNAVNRRFSWFLGTIGLAALLQTAPALAAPQALGLVASSGTVPLTCHGRECWAEFSAFCLQPERSSPVEGTVYRVADAKDIRLIAATQDGREISLPAADHLKITALRTHVAVRIAMSHRTLGDLALKSVAIVVGDKTTLVPTPVPGDATPQSAEELTVAAGPLRALGQTIVDQDNGGRMAAARLTSRLINALPPRGRASDDLRSQAWQRVIDPQSLQNLKPEAHTLAQQSYDDCQARVRTGAMGSLRRCLQSKHDGFLGKLNDDYWWRVKTGS